jgi:twinfilin-like protein
MTNAALIEVGDSVLGALTLFKSNPSQRGLKLVVEVESLVAKEVIPASASYEADFNGLKSHLDPREPAFIVTRLRKTAAHSEFVLVVFIPTGCPVRPRTIFASGRVPVQRRIVQMFPGMTDYFVDDIRDMGYAQFLRAKRTDDAPLTVEEHLRKGEAADFAVGAVRLPTHDSFTWPVDDSLRTRLVTFTSGSGPSVVAGMASPTGSAISFAGQGASLSEIDGSQPRYVAIRFNKRGVSKNFFVIYCPDTAHPRQKMMMSTCKQSFLKVCKEIGLAFEQTFEIRDASEFSDNHFAQLVNSAPVTTPTMTSPYGETRIAPKWRVPEYP